MKNDDYCAVSVATFSKLAERYAKKFFHLDMYDAYLARFAQGIKSRASVVDLACGPGNVCAYLMRLRPDLKLLGVDLAEGMIGQARCKVPTAEFVVADCRRIGELGRVFDAAAFAFGLSYLTDEDAGRFFVSLNGALTDDATLYFATITGEQCWSGFEMSSTADRVYIEYRSADAVISMIERAGFAVEYKDVIASPPSASKRTQDLVVIARRR
jgi:SAM-dependent methyltransferase